ncbi:MAG: family 16 glycosylhydrolase [Granulosicoccus sp.]
MHLWAPLLASLFYVSTAMASGPGVPGIPLGAIDAREITLTWQAATDDETIAGYNVYRNGHYVATVTETLYIDELDETESTRYYVTAFDSPTDGSRRSYSNRSEEVSFVPTDLPIVLPDSTTPTAPIDLIAIRSSPATVEVNWQASIDDAAVIGYNLYRDDIYFTTVNHSPVTDSDVDDGQEHTYYVIAFDEPRNFSARSDVATANAEASTPPPVEDPDDPIVDPPDTDDPDTLSEPPDSEIDSTPPAIVSGLATELASETQIIINWQPSEDNVGTTGYNVYRNGNYLTTVFDTRFDDSELPDTESVLYAITAFDEALNFTPLSLSLSVVPRNTDAPAGDLPAPDALETRLVSIDWVEFRWLPVADAVAYNVYRDNALIYTVDNEKDSNEDRKYWQTTSYIDCNFTRYLLCESQGPLPGSTHDYQVTSVGADGVESSPSSVLTVQLLDNERLDVPTLLAEFELVFDEEFSGDTVNSEHWNTRLPWGPDRTINGERQYFVDLQNQADFGYDPFVFTGDTLQITGIATPPELLEQAKQQPFLSGALTTRDDFNFTYGYVESRQKVASGTGKLSAFFLFHQWAALNAAEIDIIEFLGESPTISYQTYHYRDERDGQTTHSSPTMYHSEEGIELDEAFHTYAVLWDPQQVVWLLDGEEILRLEGPEVSRQRMYLTLYMVLGSAWTPTPNPDSDDFPAPFEIDYIRVWQRPVFIP